MLNVRRDRERASKPPQASSLKGGRARLNLTDTSEWCVFVYKGGGGWKCYVFLCEVILLVRQTKHTIMHLLLVLEL